MAARATAALAGKNELLLSDLVVAECVYVLESFYEVERSRVAELMRSAIALSSVTVVDAALLLRSLELYETERIDFAEAYLVASAEATGVGAILSIRPLDRPSRERHAPRALSRSNGRPPATQTGGTACRGVDRFSDHDEQIPTAHGRY